MTDSRTRSSSTWTARSSTGRRGWRSRGSRRARPTATARADAGGDARGDPDAPDVVLGRLRARDRGRMDLDGASREIVRHAFADLGSTPMTSPTGWRTTIARCRLRADRAVSRRNRDAGGVPARGIPHGADHERRGAQPAAERRDARAGAVLSTASSSRASSAAASRTSASSGTRSTPSACDAATPWMVGDSLEADIAPAVALGMHAVWVDGRVAGCRSEPPCSRTASSARSQNCAPDGKITAMATLA